MSTPDLHALAATARQKAQAVSAAKNPAISAALLAQCDVDDAVANLLQPVTPQTPHVGNGFILFRYGSSWTASPVSGYTRYGVVVVGYGNDADVAKLQPAVTGLDYRTAVEVYDATDPQLSLGGVTLATARANGWLLKDAGGNEITVPGGYHCGNLSHPGYQYAWAQTLAARAQATGVHGFFIDNVDPDYTVWPFSAAPVNLYGGVSFRDAYADFLAKTRTLIPNLYRLCNCGPGGASWVTKIAPSADGFLFESPQLNVSGAQAFVTAAQNAGKDAYWLVTSTDPASATAKSLAVSFKSVWNGNGGGLGFDYGQADPWNTNWTSVIAP